MKSIQGIMIRTEIFRQGSAVDRSAEHSAQRWAVDDAAVDAKANDAPGKLIHHDQNPMRFQDGGLTPKQIATPQAVLGVAEEGEPGRTSAIRFRLVMLGQDPANNVLVDFDVESQCDLLRDTGASPTRI